MSDDSVLADEPRLEALFGRGDDPALAARLEAADAPLVLHLSSAPSAGWVDSLGDGVRSLALPLYGARAAVHDHIAGEGDFERTLAAFAAARARRLPTLATTPLLRANARVLTELPPRLIAMGVGGWLLAWPRLSSGTPSPFTRLLTRLGLGLPSALAAAADARRRGAVVRLAGMPRCGLGPYGPLALTSPARSHPEPCTACPARPHCPGVDEAYVERFGADELHPLDALPKRTRARRSDERHLEALAGLEVSWDEGGRLTFG